MLRNAHTCTVCASGTLQCFANALAVVRREIARAGGAIIAHTLMVLLPHLTHLLRREADHECGASLRRATRTMPSWLKHVLLSEFDIDTGSQLSVAYPPLPEGTDSSFFADMMLPEGMHLRENDWTVFFLTPSPRVTEAKASSSAEDATPSTATVPTADDASGGMTFCLNVAGRRLDRTTRRGAHVKALALCTSHHFLVAFKEGLSQALELAFESPTLATVKHIYDAFAAVNFDTLPSLNRADRCMRRPLLLDSSTGKATLRANSTTSASVRLRCPMLVPDEPEAELEAESVRAEDAEDSAVAERDAVGEGAGITQRGSATSSNELRRRQSCIHALIPGQ